MHFGSILASTFLLVGTLSLVAQPANDNFAEAENLPLGSITTATNFQRTAVLGGSTMEAGETPHIGWQGTPMTGSAWYHFRPAVRGTLRIEYDESGVEMQTYFGSSLSTLTNIHPRIREAQNLSVFAGQDYYIRVLTYSGETFPIDFTFTPRSEVQLRSFSSPFEASRLLVEPPPSGDDNRYPADQIIELTPVVNSGYRFTGWSGIPNYTPHEIQPDGTYVGLVPNATMYAEFEALADYFETRRRISGVTAQDAEFNHGSSEPDEPQAADPGTVWWSWVAPHTGPATVQFSAYDFNVTGLATGRLFEGQQLKFLIPLSDRVGSQIEFSAIAGREYNLQVSEPSQMSIWVRFKQTPPIQALAPHFSMDPSAPGYLYRHYYGEPSTVTPKFSGAAEGLVEGWWKVDRRYTNVYAPTRIVGRGKEFRERQFSAGEVFAFIEFPPGPQTISFTSRNCALYAGANNVLIADGQSEVTFESPGGIIPFRLIYWSPLDWGVRVGGILRTFDLSELAPKMSYQVTPTIDHVWSSVSTFEDAEGAENHAQFTVHRSGSTNALAVQLVSGGTAEAGIDHVAQGSSILIPENESSRSVTFIPMDDTSVEGPEYATFVLQTDGNYLLSTNMGGIIYIADNDTNSAPLEVSIVSPTSNSQFVDPANLVFELSISHADGIKLAELIYHREGEATAIKTSQTNLPPFTLVREGMPAGIYDFQAIVHTYDGNTATSSPVRIVVNPDPNFEVESGLVHWWRAEDNARDAVGTSHGQPLYEATYGPGRIGRAFQTFGGVFQFDVPDTIRTGLTVQAWVKASDYSGYILSKSPDVQISTYALYYGPSFTVAAGNSLLFLDRQNRLSSNVWHLITGTFDGSEARLYYDGDLVETRALAFPAPIREGDSNFIIGAFTESTESGAGLDPKGPWFTENFNGWIDEVKIYDRVLSAVEVNAAFLAAQSPQFVVEPASISAEVGSSIELSAVLTGTPPIIFQWQYDSEILPDETNATLVIPFLSHTNAGTYTLVASNIAGSVSRSVVVTAVLPSVSISPTAVSASEGGPPAEVTLSRTGKTNYPLEIFFSIEPGTALLDDFVSPAGSVTIPVGESSVTALIALRDDFEPEPVETATLRLDANAAYVLETAASTLISIEDNDMPDPFGLIGFWKFEGDAADEQRLNDGTVIPPVSFIPGFDGLGLAPENGFVRVPYTHLLQPTNITIQASVRHSQAVGPAAEYIVAMNPNGVNSAFELFVQEDRLHFIVVTSGGRFETSSPAPELFDDQFHYVTATYDGSFVQLYLDGVELSRAPANGRIVYELGGLEGLYIGDYSDGSIDESPSPAKFNFSGVIDELRIHDRALIPQFVSVIQHPASIIRSKGALVTFEVSASANNPLTYQWQFNSSDIPGQTNSVLTLESATETDAGIYRVIVHAGDQTVISDPAHLTILDLQLNSTDARVLEIFAPLGDVYVIEYLDDLSDTTSWAPMGELTIESSPAIFTDASNLGGSGFYRVRHK